MSKKFNLYIGKAGHLAIMSEFLMRGWNVAIPEVDIGDDIFVVKDENGDLRRVQVKTGSANYKKNPEKYSSSFQIPIDQVETIKSPLIYYIFIVRKQNSWTHPLIIRQDILLDHIVIDKIGSKYKSTVVLYFSFSDRKVLCSKQNFSKYIDDYADFPIINH